MGGSGRLITLSQRSQILDWVDEACQQGARRYKACEVLGISIRTLQRWRDEAGEIKVDGRQRRDWVPVNKLSEAECEHILSVINTGEFAALAPAQIVPILAERGVYLASESTIYRILRQAQQLNHRQSSRVGQPRSRPKARCATGPNQCYSWDISYLTTAIKGQYYYLYLVLDIYSRLIVGWRIEGSENSDYAAELIDEIATREGIERDQLMLHSDNGSPMKGATLLATLHQLGIVPSFSRPAVSNDNPYSESLFRTVKYHPEFPTQPFADLEQARTWMSAFVDWYNHHHRHSAIQFVTPEQRHCGEDTAILAQRQATYQAAKNARPERWTGRQTRNWDPVTEVWLNPDKSDPKTAC